jgi:hypothetical protein
MPEAEAHISLEDLWKYRSEMVLLSPDQLHHLYICNDCLALLGVCQISKTLDEAERLQHGKPRAGTISD